MTRTVHRFRLTAVCLGLVVLAFLQEPGRVAADTKLDLALDPVSFLGRALHLWDDNAFFGQMQNQAYGYLWPVGPFFSLLHSIGVAPWAAQRLWWSVVLVVGFLGFVLLARHLGIRAPLARVVAGLGYVLGARMVSQLGAVSSEVWPMAVLPWLLLPLVIGSQRGSPRRWAALSGLAFLATGSINAVASLAILPAGALFLITRERGLRTRMLTRWWALSIALASLWWALPLLLLGRYSPPFLDWIEGAAITTGQTDLTTVLRGATHWVPYLIDAQGPVWPAGWQLVGRPVVVAASAVACLLGVAGLLARRAPERAFLILTLSAGVMLTGAGHFGSSGHGAALAAGDVRELLDGPLAPLRNLHKFQPLVTLPLMVGFAHFMAASPQWMASRSWTPKGRAGADLPGKPWGGRVWLPVTAAVSAAAVAVAALPVLTGTLVGGRSFQEIPVYWRQAADWLNERSSGRALVVPAASFAVYVWGRTQDEPLQALDTQSWAVRDAVPLSSAGNIRLLDEIERHLASGTGSPGLAPALARSGIRWLVVRNDLDTRATAAAQPVMVHQALAHSPGISRAATFGPVLRAPSGTSRIGEGGLLRNYPAVEVFGVDPDPRTVAGRVALRDASEVVHVRGSAEAMVDLLAGGLVRGEPAIMDGDALPADARAVGVVTDTFRRAEANFGASTNQYSNTLTDAEPFRSDRPVHDYDPVDPTGRRAEARLDGAASVRASSSGSSPFSLRARSPGAQPWAALDGDPQTAWISGDLAPGVGQWWQVDLARPIVVPEFDVWIVGDMRVGQQAARLRITTAAASDEVDVAPTSSAQRIRLSGSQPTSFVRVELAGVRGGGRGQGFGLSEVRMPGVEVERPILTPPWRADGGLALAAGGSQRESCAATEIAVVCDPRLALPGEERSGLDRVVEVHQAGTYRLSARLRPRPGQALDAYLAAPRNAIRVAASSQLTSDPAVRAQAAADQQTRTTWIASPLDEEPMLDVRLPRRQVVTGLLLSTAPDAPASRPLAVTVEVKGVSFPLFTDRSGRVDIPPTRTDRLRIRFSTTSPVRSLDAGTAGSRLLPVGVTELQVLGGADRRMLQPAESAVEVPCGFGPGLAVDGGQPVITSVSTTAGDIIEGRLADARGCAAPVELRAGVHRIRMAPTAEWLVEEVFLTPDTEVRPPAAGAAPRLPQIRQWSATHREIHLRGDQRPLLLETTENYNAGWSARIGDEELAPYRVDGWRQAFLVPPNTTGTVVLRYRPDRPYRMGLLVGLLAALCLLVFAMVPPRVGPTRPRGSLASPAVVPRGVVAGAPLVASLVAGGALGIAAAAVPVGLAALTARRWPAAPRRVTAALGLAGLGASLSLQAVFAWPLRLELAGAYDVASVVGPSLALGALAVVGWMGGAPSAGSASRAATN